MSLPEFVVVMPNDPSLTEVALEAAAIEANRINRPKWELHVARSLELIGRELLRRAGARTVDNPFAPFVNLVVDEGLINFEWYLVMDKAAIGSDDQGGMS